MAHHTQGASAPAAAHGQLPQEIIIETERTGYGGRADYIGTRAQLEAEGLLPADFLWPEGWDCMEWQDERLRYMLYRTRPPGAKGRRSQWSGVDCWRLATLDLERVDPDTARIRQKAAELAEAVWRATPEAHEASFALYRNWRTARKDHRFQAFLTNLLPAKGVRHV